MKAFFKKITDSISRIVDKLLKGVEAVFDGVITTLSRVATNPKELALLFLLSVLLFDFIFIGKLGIISYLIKVLGAIVAQITAIPFGSLIIIAILIMVFLKK